MKSRGMFIAAAAALASTGALAADLPMRKAAPVDYMRVCTQYGPGFFFIPGTDTCLRISGLARADFVGQEPAFYTEPLFPNSVGTAGALTSRGINTTGMHARGQIDLDARTSTPYGALRTFVSYRLYAGSLTGVGAIPATGQTFALTSFGGAGGLQPPVAELGRAYIEFGGLTAGRAYSFFNLPYFETFSSPLTADSANVMFAYTARFGQGWALTVAAEESSSRRSAKATCGTVLANFCFGFGGVGQQEAGMRMPMFVGALSYDNPMYSVQLSGAVREIRSAFVGPTIDDIGWAIQLGGQIRLPFIAPGDKLYGGITYTEGLTFLSGVYVDEDRFGRATGGYEEYDGVFDILAGRFRPTTVLGGHLGFLHYWTPNVRSAVSGAVLHVEDAFFGGDIIAYERYRAMGNLVWSPVAGLDIGAEVMYDKLDLGAPRQAQTFDQITGTLRVQRRF